MKRNWFYRLLLSYIPILFFVVTVLFVVFIVSLSDLTRREAQQSSEVLAKHVMHNLEYSLHAIDQQLIKEILTNDQIIAFFDPASINDPYVSYQVTEKLKDLLNTISLADSIYLYRTVDQMVISNNVLIRADVYGDKEFIQNYGIEQRKYAWTDPRSFYEFGTDQVKSVVTLVKPVPLLGGSQGLVVVNVSTAAVDQLFQEMSKSELSDLYLTDSREQQFQGVMNKSANAVYRPWEAKDQQTKVTVSSISGWELHSSLKPLGFLRVGQAISPIWLLIGLFGVLLGCIWIVFASRRHSKPVETILERVQAYSLKKSVQWGRNGSEFNYIESAIDRLVEQAETLEKQASESSQYKHKMLFSDMLKGYRIVSSEEWSIELQRLGWSEALNGYTVVALEIDRYQAFTEEFNSKDQYLLKFVVLNVLREMAGRKGLPIWAEWLSSTQVSILASIDREQGTQLLECLQELMLWIEDNLTFTVTIALGEIVGDISEVALSQEQAEKLLSYKETMGINRILESKLLEGKPQREIYELLPTIRSMAESYRLGEEKWREKLGLIFSEVKAGVYTREDLTNLLQYTLYHLFREMQELSSDYREIWNEQAQEQLQQLIESFQMLEELEQQLTELLEIFFNQLTAIRESKSVHSLMKKARDYVDEHYTDANLSLVQLGDQFSLTPSYLSRLFKEETGEKLVDYLAKVRIVNAKRLLEETDEPIQDIASLVGYVHAFSFIRVFKKIVGQTPGEYRKCKD